jgi:two-component sensor histidine kinase
LKIKFIYILLLSSIIVFAEDNKFIYNSTSGDINVGSSLEIYEDSTNLLTINEVSKLNSFINYNKDIPSFGLSKSTFWAKFDFINNSEFDDFILHIDKVDVLKLVVYYKDANDNFIEQTATKNTRSFSKKSFLYNLHLENNQIKTIYIQFKTNWSVVFPVMIDHKYFTYEKLFNDELINGMFTGIFLVMFFYNLFLYFSIRDKSYLFYVCYILLFLLFQLLEDGYFYDYISINTYFTYGLAIRILPVLTGIAAIYFVRYFVKSPLYSPSIDKFYIVIIAFYIINIFITLKPKLEHLSYLCLNTASICATLYAIVLGISVIKKGFKPAWFFIIAWAILMFSVLYYSLSHLGVLPYNQITEHILKIGSVIEIVLLSLGLANKINVLKSEKESSQALALQLINEKKVIIENQNMHLENMVAERTKKLEDRNIVISKKNKEKSIMMREIHHRVKNNLQMISSMVRIQSRYEDNDESQYSLKQVERRIQTMALLHEKIYQSENLSEINIKAYIRSIVLDLFTIYNVEKTTTYNLNIINYKYETETVLYLGLLINELLTNALKHSFLDEEKGHIKIKIEVINEKEHKLTISSSGKRINIEEFYNSKSLGNHLINNFVRQLDGTLTINNSPETSFEILFNIPN